MKIRYIRAMFTALCLIVLATTVARADSYKIQVLISGVGDREAILQADGYGDYVVSGGDLGASCPDPGGSCYMTNYANGQVVYSDTRPVLPFDPSAPSGPGCGWTMPGGGGGQTLCNNGHEIFIGYVPGFTPDQELDLWDGPSVSDLVYQSHVIEEALLASDGDIYFNTGFGGDDWLRAVDQTPEPSSLVLAGSGLAGMAEILRRRRLLNACA